MNKISYKLLEELDACEDRLDWYLENFGEMEYTVSQLLKKIKAEEIAVLPWNISWLMVKCKFARTPGMIKFYMESKPPAEDVSWIIINCKFAQTSEMLQLFMESEPTAEDIFWLIYNCKFARIPKMLQLFIESNLTVDKISRLKEKLPELESKINDINESPEAGKRVKEFLALNKIDIKKYT
jgi:hypothetical protein